MRSGKAAHRADGFGEIYQRQSQRAREQEPPILQADLPATGRRQPGWDLAHNLHTARFQPKHNRNGNAEEQRHQRSGDLVEIVFQRDQQDQAQARP